MAKDVIKNWVQGCREPLLPEAEILRLAKIVQTTSCARKRKAAIDKLVRCNLRLVPKVVSGYMLSRTKYRLSDDRICDYLQQGVIGLIRAAEKFDPERGYKFSTYAYRWIRQAIGRYHYQNFSVIKVPETVLSPMMNGHADHPNSKFYLMAKRAINLDSLDREIVSNGSVVTLGALAADTASSLGS